MMTMMVDVGGDDAERSLLLSQSSLHYYIINDCQDSETDG